MQRDAVRSVTPDASISEVLQVLETSPCAQIPVVRDGWVVGVGSQVRAMTAGR
jgi:predicted transcriptional regulator